MTSDKKWDYTQFPGYEKYPHLFKPIKIGSLEIPNRIKYAATEDNLNNHDGYVTDADEAYIRERAKGVVGGICTIQGVYMDPKGEGQGYVGQAAAYDDKFIPGLKRLADAIHEEGAISNYQLMHCGRVGGVELPYCVGPTKMPQRLRVFKPVKEMSKEDIETCIKEHADATRRGLEAGYQIMEISGIVGYLVSNFLSAYTNRRTDEYGGDIEGRCTFMVKIIEAVRDVCGKEVPIVIRLCAEELLDDVGGNTPEESMVTYKLAEKAGVDCLSVTQGWQESSVPVISRDIPQGTWLYNAKRAKEAVSVPVSMAYRLFLPEYPNKAIEDLIRIFGVYHRAVNSHSRLYLVGSRYVAAYDEQLDALVASLGLQDYVTFTGLVSQSDLKTYYQVADLYLHASHHEGFCVPLIESMYFGVPILARKATAVPETLGDAGVLFTRLGYQEVAEMAHLLLTDGVLQAQVVARQRERLQDFAPSQVEARLRDILIGLGVLSASEDKAPA